MHHRVHVGAPRGYAVITFNPLARWEIRAAEHAEEDELETRRGPRMSYC